MHWDIDVVSVGLQKVGFRYPTFCNLQIQAAMPGDKGGLFHNEESHRLYEATVCTRFLDFL
jgi:hypothetical protein